LGERPKEMIEMEKDKQIDIKEILKKNAKFHSMSDTLSENGLVFQLETGEWFVLRAKGVILEPNKQCVHLGIFKIPKGNELFLFGTESAISYNKYRKCKTEVEFIKKLVEDYCGDYGILRDIWLDMIIFYKQNNVELPEELRECYECRMYDLDSPHLNTLTLVIASFIRGHTKSFAYNHPRSHKVSDEIKYLKEGIKASDYVEKNKKIVYNLLCSNHLIKCRKCNHLSITENTIRRLNDSKPLCGLHFAEQFLKEITLGVSPELFPENCKPYSVTWFAHKDGTIKDWTEEIKKLLELEIKYRTLRRSLNMEPVYIKVNNIENSIVKQIKKDFNKD
jgi:hypothetical protein